MFDCDLIGVMSKVFFAEETFAVFSVYGTLISKILFDVFFSDINSGRTDYILDKLNELVIGFEKNDEIGKEFFILKRRS